MKCGFYEFDITPPIGSIIPGGFAARYAREILDKLYARAFVADNGGKILAIVAVDACGVTEDIVARIRERVSGYTPIPTENVMVMATHAHGAGPTLNWGEEVVRNEAYIDLLVAKAADAVYVAWQKMTDSQLYPGSEDLYGVSFIRVYHLKDGSLRTNPGDPAIIDRPTTTIDPKVGVLAVKQADRFVGAVIHFTTHPATVGDNRTTGDYISALSARMKAYYGEDFVTVFINGACGNINHIDPFDSATTNDPWRYRYVGEKIAETAKSIMEKAKPETSDVLGVDNESIKVKFRKPTPEQLLESQEMLVRSGEEAVTKKPGTPGYSDLFFCWQRFEIMADKRLERDVALQAFRIGSTYIAGTPTQLFVEFGKRIKAACPGLCMVSAFANDYCGYVPTPECMVPGVYEARLARTSALESAAGDKVTEAMIGMLGKLDKYG